MLWSLEHFIMFTPLKQRTQKLNVEAQHLLKHEAGINKFFLARECQFLIKFLLFAKIPAENIQKGYEPNTGDRQLR